MIYINPYLIKNCPLHAPAKHCHNYYLLVSVDFHQKKKKKIATLTVRHTPSAYTTLHHNYYQKFQWSWSLTDMKMGRAAPN